MVKLDRKQNNSVDERSFWLGQVLKCMKLCETLVKLMVFIELIVQSSNALITKINICKLPWCENPLEDEIKSQLCQLSLPKVL